MSAASTVLACSATAALLLLAAGELARIVAGALTQPDAAQRLGGGAPRIAPARQLQRQHHVLERRERRDQMEGLEHESDALRPQSRATVLVESGEILALEEHPSARRQVEPGEQREQRRLARARRPGHGDRLARENLE